MIFVSNWFATAAGPRLRWFVLRTIVLQNRGVCSSLYSQGCSPDSCASGKAKGLKQLRPGLIARSRAECEHRVLALTRAARASLFERLLNDLFAGRFDSGAADGFASLSGPLRHGAPCASAADSTSSPARSADRLPPPTSLSMLQQKLPWQLTFQLPPSRRRLACYLSRGRLRMPFPPTPTSRQTSPRPRAQILPSALSVSLRGSFANLIPFSFSLSTQRFGMHHTTGGITQTYVPELLQEAWPLAFHRHLESLVVTEYSGGCPARGPHNSSRRVNKTARNCRYTRGRTQERVLSDAVENETAYWPFLQNPRAPSLVENGPVFRPLSAGSVELSHPRRVIASSVTSEAMCAEYLTRYAQLLQTSFSAAKFAQLRNIITYGKPRAVAGVVGPHKRMTGIRCK